MQLVADRVHDHLNIGAGDVCECDLDDSSPDQKRIDKIHSSTLCLTVPLAFPAGLMTTPTCIHPDAAGI